MERLSKELLAILACPVDKADLEISKDGRYLTCTKCHHRYHITDGIPNLLPSK